MLVSGLLILFLWPMCLFLCQYRTVLMTVLLWAILMTIPWASLVVQLVKNLPAMWETWV